MGRSTLRKLIERPAFAYLHTQQDAAVQKQIESSINGSARDPFPLPAHGEEQVLRGEVSLHSLNVVPEQLPLTRAARIHRTFCHSETASHSRLRIVFVTEEEVKGFFGHPEIPRKSE